MARIPSWLGRATAQATPIEAKSYPSTTAYMIPAGQAVWMRRDTAKFADEGYRRNVIAHRAVAMIATAAASVPWKLSERRARVSRMVDAHPLLTLLSNPNPLQGGTELCEALYAHRLIAGNSYLHAIGPKDGAPLELHALRPDRVAIIPGHGGIPKAYRYTIDNRAVDIAVDAITGQSRILHLKTFHPLDDWYGLSPMEAAAYSIDQHNQCSAWNQALLQNGARPSGALMVKAAEGYPGDYRKNTRIKGLADAADGPETFVFHAGTALDAQGNVVATGGRVLGVTGFGADTKAAQTNAYRAVDCIEWPEGFCRRDIGWREIGRAA